jgi:glutamate-1-semialdehyde 2,1-aminomutase
MDHNISLFERAQKTIPGGVNSPARAFKSVGGTPLFIERAEGAYIYDANGNAFVDYINSWGPMILGHAFKPVKEALNAQLEKSFSYGAPTMIETAMAELVCEMVPNIEMVRMVNSGTEACLAAIRLARGYTGRDKIVKFIGCYHGHADSFLKKAGSGLATLEIDKVPGVPSSTLENTLLADYNDLDGVRAIFSQHAGEIAAIIVEPVGGNMGCIPPKAGFLEGLRALCKDDGALLIFDEVMTGFRLAPGGAQEKLGIQADMVTYGKVIGGGLPVGAFGASKEIMSHIAPLGEVYQAGTLSGNPLAMWAGYTQLKYLFEHPDVYTHIEKMTKALADGIEAIMKKKGISVCINQIGSMISVHFTDQEEVLDFTASASCDIKQFNRFFHHMLNMGIYLPPSSFESWFISNAIGESEIQKTLEAISAYE